MNNNDQVRQLMKMAKSLMNAGNKKAARNLLDAVENLLDSDRKAATGKAPIRKNPVTARKPFVSNYDRAYKEAQGMTAAELKSKINSLKDIGAKYPYHQALKMKAWAKRLPSPLSALTTPELDELIRIYTEKRDVEAIKKLKAEVQNRKVTYQGGGCGNSGGGCGR